MAHMRTCACGNAIKTRAAKVCVRCRNKATNAKRAVSYDADYIRKWSTVDSATGCWMWRGACDYAGYGKVSRKSGEGIASRLAYRVFTGREIQGEIDHLCYEPACVNPDHLRDVTPSENCSRKRNVLEARARDTCKHGHPWTEETTIWRGTTRLCRVCGRLANNRSRAARRAAEKAAHAVTK